MSWTRATVPDAGKLSTDLTGVTSNSEGLVAVGNDGTALVSAEGENWTRMDTGTTADLTDIVTAPAGFVIAVGSLSTQGVVFRSDNPFGQTPWSNAGSGLDRLVGVRASATGGFVATSESGGIYTSATGASWTYHDTGTTHELRGVARCNDRLIAVGNLGGNIGGIILESTDGETWKGGRVGDARLYYDVACSPDRTVVAGSDGVILSTP